MNNREHQLSGEEALNEYFSALLDEELELVDEPAPVPEVAMAQPVPGVSEVPVDYSATASEPGKPEPIQAEPKIQVEQHPDYQASYTELGYNEFEVPDLEDVQKLLDKLERTDLAAEPEIDSLIQQNTVSISHIEETPVVEEIQEWEIETEAKIEPVVEVVVEAAEAEPEIIREQEVELQTQAGGLALDDWTNTKRDEDFQVLYFDVNGITFAVPLDQLGGIHRTGDMSHLIGRPDWYLGLQTNKDEQLDVVDTAKWVMADRLSDEAYKEAYQYIVMLGDSGWGLAATELKGTESLNVESVRWREQAGKRPWLAGMVKEKMCALIHVGAMVAMITAGLDVKSLDH